MVLGEFARTLMADFPIQGILDHFVKRIVEVLPITSAGVTLISAGVAPHYVAASDDAALRFEQLQSNIGEGPCVHAYRDRATGRRAGPPRRATISEIRARSGDGRAGCRVHLPFA